MSGHYEITIKGTYANLNEGKDGYIHVDVTTKLGTGHLILGTSKDASHIGVEIQGDLRVSFSDYIQPEMTRIDRPITNKKRPWESTSAFRFQTQTYDEEKLVTLDLDTENNTFELELA